MEDKKFAERKKLRLKNYSYDSHGVYFITVCTVEKRHILGKIVGGDAFIAPHIELSEYGSVVEKYIKSIKGIDVFTIMPNHIHMIIRIGHNPDGTMWASSWLAGESSAPASAHGRCAAHTSTADRHGTMWASSPTQSIPQLIKSFKTLVTKSCGKSIFQRSYYDHIIRDERDYLEKREYIENNAAKWVDDKYYNL
ncbi:MAG: hypothetical protein IJD80_05945 [Oscillospiraceae bacterium]|nr:hypothetical protein [Oscillospiraceae bacterium]